MKQQKSPTKYHIVKMDNALIRARHGLSLSEKRLIAYALSKANNFNEGKGIRITAQEFANAFNVETPNAYRDLKAATNDLLNRVIVFQLKDRIRKMPWVGFADYLEKEGYVEIAFNSNLAPLLFNLKEKFTQYSLESAKSLRSHYSWRLMEMLERFRNADKDKNGFNFWKSTMEELYLTFEAPESCQKKFNNFKTKIIEMAVKEVNEKTSWIVKWEPIKTGRKITSIKFLFKLDEQLNLGLDR